MSRGLYEMRKTLIAITITLMAALTSCRQEKVKALNKSPEQIRLEQVNHMDSTMSIAYAIPKKERAMLDSMTAEAWMLIDDQTGMVISAKNARQRHYIASLTKMMTALLALEKEGLTDTIELTADVYKYNYLDVKKGDSFVMGDLIFEMMMRSDNNAAYALAKQVAGDTLAFYEMMNSKAKYLSMDSTHFANPNGMPCADNYSSAADLTRLVRYCMRDSAFAAIVGAKGKSITLTDGRHLYCRNSNELIHNYNGCTGVKSGFTTQAGYCLASSATREGYTLILVLLNCKSSERRFAESATLLDYGFNALRLYYQSPGHTK